MASVQSETVIRPEADTLFFQYAGRFMYVWEAGSETLACAEFDSHNTARS